MKQFLSGNVAPASSMVNAYPRVACDSFVTFGLLQLPANQLDCTATTPGFALNATHFKGGWFCANPVSAQAGGASSITLAQLTVDAGGSVGVNLRLHLGSARVDLQAKCGANAASLQLPPLPTTTTARVAVQTTGATTTLSAPTAPPTQASSGSSSSSRDWIIGVVIGAIVFIAISAIAIIVLYRKQNRTRPHHGHAPVATSHHSALPVAPPASMGADTSFKAFDDFGADNMSTVDDFL